MTPPPRRQAHNATSPSRLLSTTEGRQRFPDILQTCFGDKAVIGFDRYGRALGAVVPMEAVRLLAGFQESVEPRVREAIAETAKELLREVPAEARMCGMEDVALEEGMVAGNKRG